MSDNSETAERAAGAETADKRKRGRRPADAEQRRLSVLRAREELESARAPFSMADLAERAGISRATLYRDAGLRDLIGSAGDSPAHRPINQREYERVKRERDTLRTERRQLRAELRRLEQRLEDARAQAREAVDESLKQGKHSTADRGPSAATGSQEKIRTEAYAEGFAAGMKTAQQRMGATGSGAGGRAAAAAGVGSGLLTIAMRLPQPTLQNARRTLARALHPDLYVKDPAAALLATELLKQINAITGGNA